MHKSMQAVAYIDGSSLQNPGYAALAVRIYDAQGRLLHSLCEPIGKQTNNFAEYYALLRCLQEALQLGVQHLTVYTDAELLSKQWTGEYQVRAENLRPLYNEAKQYAALIGSVQIVWVRPSEDKRAQLVNKLAQEAAEHVQRFGQLEQEE